MLRLLAVDCHNETRLEKTDSISLTGKVYVNIYIYACRVPAERIPYTQGGPMTRLSVRNETYFEEMAGRNLENGQQISFAWLFAKN